MFLVIVVVPQLVASYNVVQDGHKTFFSLATTTSTTTQSTYILSDRQSRDTWIVTITPSLFRSSSQQNGSRHSQVGSLFDKQTISYTFIKYRTRAIITRSSFETALNYKPRNFGSKIEDFPCLVHKLSVTLTALQYKPQ